MNSNTYKTNNNNIALAISEPSICIPRVFQNIDEKRIRRIFDQLNLGQIHHLDILERSNEKGDKFNRVFVHFASWSQEPDAVTARTKLLEGKKIKIVYDDPWFWEVSASQKKEKEKEKEKKEKEKEKKERKETRPTERPNPRIIIEEEEKIQNSRAADNFMSNLTIRHETRNEIRPRDEYRRDEYRRDEYRRPEYRRDEYRRDEYRRDEYRRDEYRKDEKRRPLSDNKEIIKNQPEVKQQQQQQQQQVVKPVINTPKPQRQQQQQIVKKEELVIKKEVEEVNMDWELEREKYIQEQIANREETIPLDYSALPAVPPKRKRGKIIS